MLKKTVFSGLRGLYTEDNFGQLSEDINIGIYKFFLYFLCNYQLY
jgi:hypothetical protein